MKTIGLIGGMSWESTAVYYRLLNEAARAARGGLASAEILVHSLDFSAIVALQKAGRWDLAAERLAGSAQKLERAGADCILICTNTMHLVAPEVSAAVKVPVIDIVGETGRALAAAGRRRPLLLATRYTMEHGFYADRMEAAHGIRPLVPNAEDRTLVHSVIFDELCQGKVLDASRDRMLAVVARGRAAGADSVILGCTEICLLLDPQALELPGFDSTTIHAAAASAFALRDGGGEGRIRTGSDTDRRLVSFDRPGSCPAGFLQRAPRSMCRFLAYSGTPVFLDRLLIRPRSSLISQSLSAREAKTVVNGDGCGVGWYGEIDEPGVYRGILPAWSDANLASLCRQIRSRLFLAHVRSATSGEVSTANCHPFAVGRHLFMHNGQVGGYDTLRRRVDALIPDALYPLRKGTSDSEAIFLAAMGRGLDADPVSAIAATLSEIVAATGAEGRENPLRFAAVHTDGDTLYAYRWASDGNPPSLYWRAEGDGIVIASEPCDENEGVWGSVPPGTVLAVGAGRSARLTELVVGRGAEGAAARVA